MNLAGRVGIFAETQGESPGGILTLQPYQGNPDLNLTLQQGVLVSASTSGSGSGGNLAISAPENLTISGPGRLAVETLGTGTAGNINVEAARLTLAGGVVLSASTTPDSTGDGGNIAVNADVTTLLDSSQITVNSAGVGQGGNIRLDGDRLILNDNSRITATTLSSDGSNLTLDLQDFLVLRDGSEISTTAGNAGAGGNGGNINIATEFIVAVPNENSDITANAFDGNGGNVDITVTGGLFGIAPRSVQTPLSDITASSQNGIAGLITVQAPDIDPSQDLAELPANFDAPEVAQSCREAFVQTGSSFTVSGRGGIPQGPLDLPTGLLWQDVLPIEGEGAIAPAAESNAATNSSAAPTPAPIVEAQEWTRNEQGQIVLMAKDAQTTTDVGQPLECSV